VADQDTRVTPGWEGTPTQQRILDRAGELFHQFGFKRVTMDDIAHQLGMSKKTLYQHIPGKDALVEAFIENVAGQALGAARELFSGQGDIIDVTSTLIPLVHSRLQSVSPVMMADLQRHWPHLWDRINERRMAVLNLYLGRLEEAKAQGLLRDEVNPKVMVRVIQAVVQEVAIPKTILELEVPVGEVLQTFMTIMMRGALSDDAQRRFEEGP
jgi:AcrR family transcriptional regulator